jgi:hypothetical protein
MTTSRGIEWVGHAARVRGEERFIQGFGEGKSPLRRPRHRCEDNIKMYLKEVGLKGVNWIDYLMIGTSYGLLLRR